MLKKCTICSLANAANKSDCFLYGSFQVKDTILYFKDKSRIIECVANNLSVGCFQSHALLQKFKIINEVLFIYKSEACKVSEFEYDVYNSLLEYQTFKPLLAPKEAVKYNIQSKSGIFKRNKIYYFLVSIDSEPSCILIESVYLYFCIQIGSSFQFSGLRKVLFNQQQCLFYGPESTLFETNEYQLYSTPGLLHYTGKITNIGEFIQLDEQVTLLLCHYSFYSKFPFLFRNATIRINNVLAKEMNGRLYFIATPLSFIEYAFEDDDLENTETVDFYSALAIQRLFALEYAPLDCIYASKLCGIIYKFVHDKLTVLEITSSLLDSLGIIRKFKFSVFCEFMHFSQTFLSHSSFESHEFPFYLGILKSNGEGLALYDSCKSKVIECVIDEYCLPTLYIHHFYAIRNYSRFAEGIIRVKLKDFELLKLNTTKEPLEHSLRTFLVYAKYPIKNGKFVLHVYECATEVETYVVCHLLDFFFCIRDGLMFAMSDLERFQDILRTTETSKIASVTAATLTLKDKLGTEQSTRSETKFNSKIVERKIHIHRIRTLISTEDQLVSVQGVIRQCFKKDGTDVIVLYDPITFDRIHIYVDSRLVETDFVLEQPVVFTRVQRKKQSLSFLACSLWRYLYDVPTFNHLKQSHLIDFHAKNPPFYMHLFIVSIVSVDRIILHENGTIDIKVKASDGSSEVLLFGDALFDVLGYTTRQKQQLFDSKQQLEWSYETKSELFPNFKLHLMDRWRIWARPYKQNIEWKMKEKNIKVWKEDTLIYVYPKQMWWVERVERVDTLVYLQELLKFDFKKETTSNDL